MSVIRAVLDTNVIVGALYRRDNHNRAIVRACFENRLQPIVGHNLFLEYADVLGRDSLFRHSPLSQKERQEFFEDFLSISEWVQVYYTWRPNLRDEGDNHILELAVAGGAMIVTNNLADFKNSDLRFPTIRLARPKDALEVIR
jgi:putative PIN family toxin of toxin-antitoxin system